MLQTKGQQSTKDHKKLKLGVFELEVFNYYNIDA